MSATAKDWQTLRLNGDGRTLIEASAGTGKTWTIAALYLRLLLEDGRTPRQIVVTTFGDAAAQELRERVRRNIQWALNCSASSTGTASVSPQEAWLRSRWADCDEVGEQDQKRLLTALAELDVAPITTLHSLCRRILTEHPFACGMPFSIGQLVASETVLEEVAADQWRHLQQCEDEDTLWQAAQPLLASGRMKLTPAWLRQQIAACLKPGVSLPDASATAQRPDLSWGPRVRCIVEGDVYLNKTAKLRRFLEALAQYIEDPAFIPDGDTLEGWENAPAATGVKKAVLNAPELTEVLALAAECATPARAELEAREAAFFAQLAQAARQQMQQRLQTRNQLTYDDLLTRVHDALVREQAAGTRVLADALYQAWPVALVDEFQDTDGIQYGILDAVYSDAQGASRGRLVMIGDPKQAIYGFRGGDIHAYLRAAARASDDDRLTLGTNHRSSRPLVAALNELYAACGHALTDQGSAAIGYQPVEASNRRDGTPYWIGEDVCDKPLSIHYLANCPDGAEERRRLALETCANQIAELLESGKHRIGEHRVSPSDIAVLLPTHHVIAQLRGLLRERRVPCVSASRASVFATDTARELQILLYAIANPGAIRPLRAAVATRLWGASFDELREWVDDPVRWQGIAETFRELHGVWQAQGVLAITERLIAREAMHRRFLATVDGERTLTDLRHLGELLQEQAANMAGPEELIAWLDERRRLSAGQDDEGGDVAQLRMESDSACVRLMTLHASKGLEFPIVFLPLMWAHGERDNASLWVVTNPHTGERQLQGNDAAKQAFLLEQQDERFRVLYVAMTRAIHACHVMALPPDRPAKRGSVATLKGTKRTALDVMMERAGAAVLDPELAGRTPHIDWVAGWAPDTAVLFHGASKLGSSDRLARPEPASGGGPLPSRHSFSSLNRVHNVAPAVEEASAADESLPSGSTHATAHEGSGENPEGMREPHPALKALRVVRGTEFGNAVHAVFENREVGQPVTTQGALVRQCLADAGARVPASAADFVPRLAERLDAALAAPLGLQTAPGLQLGQVSGSDLCPEMRFNLALGEVSLATLRDACVRHGYAHLVPNDRRTISGFLNGAIDLVFHHEGLFHVLDYKGNDLGDAIEGYEGPALDAAMQAAGYPFQALIYSVAVDRYLRQRMGASYRRGEHLGECVYLFIRAAGLSPTAGIWRHRFPDALIEDVSTVLDGRVAQREAA